MKINSKTVDNAIDAIESSKTFIDLVTEDLKKINLPLEMSDLQSRLNARIKEMESYNEYEKELVYELNKLKISVENIEKSVQTYLGTQDISLADKMSENNRIMKAGLYDKNLEEVYNRELSDEVKLLVENGILSEED